MVASGGHRGEWGTIDRYQQALSPTCFDVLMNVSSPCSPSQLLNEWSAHTTEAGFVAISGTVYNCPGAYDGETAHRTSAVVKCTGRMLKTVEGAEYYLGYLKDMPKEERSTIKSELTSDESKALGLLEDRILAV